MVGKRFTEWKDCTEEKDTRRDGLHSTVEENTRGEKMQRGMNYILGEDRWRNELYRGRRYKEGQTVR